METCKNEMCSEKCEVCSSKGYNCCVTTPVFKGEELARLYWHSDLIDKMGLMVTQVDSNSFVACHRDAVIGKKVDLARPCPFINKDGKCSIYEYRPSECKEYGDVYDCGFKGLSIEELKESSNDVLNYLLANFRQPKRLSINSKTKISFGSSVVKLERFNKKHLKTLKDDLFMYFLANTIKACEREDLDKLGIHTYNSYKLAMYENTKRLSCIMVEKFKIDPNCKYIEFINLYNKVANKLFIKPDEYRSILVDKLTSILKGIVIPEIKSDKVSDTELYLIVGIMVIYKYYSDFKNKANSYKGLTDKSKLFKILSDFNKLHGSNYIFTPSEVYKNAEKYADNIYKAIMRIK